MKKFFTRKNIIILLAIVAVGVGVYFLVRKKPLSEGLVQVNGRIEGDVVIVSSKYDGKIDQLLVREGDDVAQNQTLVRLDDPETRARLAQALRNLNVIIAQAKASGQNVTLTSETGNAVIQQALGQVQQAESSVAEAQSAAKSAEANIGIAEANVRSVGTTITQAQADVKRYTAEVQTAEATLASTQSGVEAARSQAKLSQQNAQRFTNLAKDGVVTIRQRDEYVTAAQKDQAQLQSAIANASAAQAQVASNQANLKRALAQVTASQADLQRAQAQLSTVMQDVSTARARVKEAMGKKTQAEGTLRQALTSPTQIAISQNQYSGALSQIAEAQAKVDEQRSILSNLFVTSPIAGRVVTRIRDNGEVVTAGSPILEVVDLNRLYLKAYVPENQIGKVRLGLPAQVYVDAYPNRAFDATVQYISSTAEFTPKEVQTPDERIKLVYAVKLYFNGNPDLRLTPGMPADAIIRWKEDAPWQKPQY
ncbi:MAG TPA: efflux RND transporter periplasmic adaptor subunit [Armatimonadota bacterium]|nr:efflux RND transporter periplasmic adaptor subunit [Armatimonadota bacterium]